MQQNDQARQTLRELGRQLHEIANDPVNAVRRDLWRRNHSLQRGRPPVFIFEIPWHEMEYNGELAATITHARFLQGLATTLRRAIYQWRNMHSKACL